MNNKEQHWLYRQENRRKLRMAGIVALLLSVIAELLIVLHPYFAIADIFAFHAVFGFISCVLLVLIAWLLGILIKRRNDYYDS